MPWALSAAASASRRPGASRIVYCAQTEVDRRGDLRQHRDAGEPGSVARRRRIARGDLLGKDLELLQNNRGLHRVEPAGEADVLGVVFVAALPVHAQAFEPGGERIVIGEDRAAVAVAAERLGREELVAVAGANTPSLRPL